MIRGAGLGRVHRPHRPALGADPAKHTAVGIGCGLERLAMLRYGIDDIRKIESARVA